MPRKSLDERLAELTRIKKELETKQTALLSKKRDADRKLDTRRKIVVGAAVLAHAEIDRDFADELRRVLDRAVQRDLDRAAIADLLPSPARSTAVA